MTLDEQIESAKRFVVVVDNTHVLFSDDQYLSARSYATDAASAQPSVVIIDKWLEEGAAGIVWRAARALTFEDVEPAFFDSEYFPLPGPPGVVYATQDGVIRAKVHLRDGAIVVELKEGKGTRAERHAKRVTKLFEKAKGEGDVKSDLWTIFVRGEAQPLKVLASDEKEAIRRWRGQTHSQVPSGAIIASPETSNQANATADDAGRRYHCWVVAKRRPREVESWFTDIRKDAVTEVKRRVRALGTEGGVESRDEHHPFEVTYAMVRGKLTETAF